MLSEMSMMRPIRGTLLRERSEASEPYLRRSQIERQGPVMTARLLVALTLLLTSCGLPKDPEGTLERVEGSAMRVGITDRPPWTVVTEGEPRGVEPALVEELARELGSEIEWVDGSESEILEEIELGHLDLAVGGFTADSPWAKQVTFIQPYFTLGEDEHVMAVPHGENAWIVRIERFLRSKLDAIPDLLREDSP
jgi:Bacterial extracellular solute-binding proteins, family 3